MARIIKHFEIVEDDQVDRVEVDYFDGDTYVYLEVKTYVDSNGDIIDEESTSALVTVSPKKAEKIGRALIKAAREARKTKEGRS